MDKIKEARRLMLEDIRQGAEQKIGRKLTETEIAGLERIRSLMMLESFAMAALSEKVDAATIKQDLAYFESQRDA